MRIKQTKTGVAATHLWGLNVTVICTMDNGEKITVKTGKEVKP
jgi:hypothetical protein